MKLLILEGPRGAGKSTLRPLIAKELNHDWHVIDRLCGSMWVYDQIHERGAAETKYTDELQGITRFAVVRQVILLNEPGYLRDRRIQRGDKVLPTFAEVEQEIEYFKRWGDLAKWHAPTLFHYANVQVWPMKTAQTIARWVLDADHKD